MSRQRPGRSPPSARQTPRGRRIALLIGLAGAAILLLVFGRSSLSRSARYLANRQLDAGAVSEAQRSLDWAAWIAPHDGETDLMRAACYRRLEQTDRWSAILQAVRGKVASSQRWQQEIRLGLIQTGQAIESGEAQLVSLLDAGLPPHDVVPSFVLGYLSRNDYERAQAVLDAWQADDPQSPHATYMRGVFYRKRAERSKALEQFRRALAQQPRHELAGIGIAELLEEQDHLEDALAEYVQLSRLHPWGERVKVGRTRVLRGLARIDEARRVLEPLAEVPDCSPEVAREMGAIELASARIPQATGWFARAELDQTVDVNTLATAATAFSLAGNGAEAERWFARRHAVGNRNTRLPDVRVRVVMDPRDQQAADELRRLSQSPLAASGPRDTPAPQPGDMPDSLAAAVSAQALYTQHCAACHGTLGDGGGLAAQHLFPRPRDFRNERFRIVSTDRGTPAREDLESVTRRGLPGTSMPAFDRLPADELRLLAEEVWRLHRDGVRQHFIDLLRSEGEAIDETEVAQFVDLRTAPGEPIRPPQFGPADPDAVARGRKLYLQQNCQSCHGDDGGGASDVTLFDDQRRPTPPRDLIRDPLKGGSDPEVIYRRLALGMPGSPHPASTNLTTDEFADLVHYTRSLAREPKRTLTNHQRALLASQRRSDKTSGSPK